jgi:actin-like protein 6A
VSSVVVDIGSYHTRAGYSGEDCPRSVIPSYVGLCESDGDVEMEGAGQGSKRRLITGGAELAFKRDAMEMQPLIQGDGIRKYQDV